MRALLTHPEGLMPLLVATALLLVAVGVSAASARRRGKRLFVDGQHAARRTDWAHTAILVAWLLITLGWLGPRIGREAVVSATEGRDWVLLFDLSRSMDARDVSSSRLEAAIRGARQLLSALGPSDRVALAGFADRGVLFTPLSPDRQAIDDLLDPLSPRLFEPGGSELAAGVAAAVEAFEPPGDRPRVVVVWSDGELSDPDGALGIEAARRAGARVLTVGVGGEAGAVIPDRNRTLLDRRGIEIVTRRSLGPLRVLAEATDGALLAADETGRVSIETLIARARRPGADARPDDGPSEAEDEPGKAQRTLVVPLAWPFVLGALFLLMAESLLTPRLVGIRGAPRNGSADRSNERGPGKRLATGVALLMAAALGAESASPPEPEALPNRFLRGLRHAQAGDTREAQADFQAVSVLSLDPRQVGLAEFNLGVLALAENQLERARDHFHNALAYQPHDDRMRFNAEWTLRAIAAQRPPEPGDASADEEDASPERLEESEPAAPAPERPPEAPSDTASSGAQERPRPNDRAQGRGAGTPAAPTELGAEERERWLDRVRDDPAKTLELATENAPGSPAPRRRMTW